MSMTTVPRFGLVYCVLSLSSLPAAHSQQGGPRQAAEQQAKRVAGMIDDLANRNRLPRLVATDTGRLPLFPTEYDWKEEERVRSALGKVHRETTPEMWEALVRSVDDQRYCLTLKDKNEFATIGNWNVGDFCVTLAAEWLLGVCNQHLPNDPKREDSHLRLDVGLTRGLKEWRKQRADKQLYELQLEVCEATIRQLEKVAGLPQTEKDQARKKIEGEIVTLRRTKRPVFTDYRVGYNTLYTAKEAAKIREELRRKR